MEDTLTIVGTLIEAHRNDLAEPIMNQLLSAVQSDAFGEYYRSNNWSLGRILLRLGDYAGALDVADRGPLYKRRRVQAYVLEQLSGVPGAVIPSGYFPSTLP